MREFIHCGSLPKIAKAALKNSNILTMSASMGLDSYFCMEAARELAAGNTPAAKTIKSIPCALPIVDVMPSQIGASVARRELYPGLNPLGG
jgi:hypothetical protein